MPRSFSVLALFAAVPDFRIRVEEVLGHDHGATIRWRATGTFTGAPPGGVALRPTAVYRGAGSTVAICTWPWMLPGRAAISTAVWPLSKTTTAGRN